MIDVINMDKVLRSVYLDVVSSSLNEKTSAFYKKVVKSGANVYGKDIIAPCRIGINGGVACTEETGNLPATSAPTLLNFKAPLVNIYGNLEISDKLLRVNDGAGGAIDVLNYEIDTLLDSAKYNMRRMLFQNGDGILASMTAAGTSSMTIKVDHTRNVIEGMVVDLMSGNSAVMTGCRITLVDKANSTVKLDKSVASSVTSGTNLVISGSYKCELYGIPYIFSGGGINLYGNTRSVIGYALPSEYTESAVDSSTLQSVVDRMEENGAERPDMILGSYTMRRKYIDSMNTAHLNIETLSDGDFKAPGFNGIPVYAEPFIEDNTMFFLNTKDFIMAQLADWSWVEGSTHEILRPIYGKAAYTATLVKYCNLICRRPKAQAKLTYSASANEG